MRKRYEKKASQSSVSLDTLRNSSFADIIDMSSLKFLYSCKATRNKKEIASMLNFDPEIKVVMVSYQTPNSFFSNWSKFFSDSNGRSQNVVSDGVIFVIYELDDEDVLHSILLPIVTESGEYLKVNGVQGNLSMAVLFLVFLNSASRFAKKVFQVCHCFGRMES